MKKYFSFFLVFLFTFIFLTQTFLTFSLSQKGWPLNSPQVWAQTQENKDYGLSETAEKAGLKPEGGTPSLAQTIGTLIGYVLSFVGVIFFLLMLYGGFLWMTARGKQELANKAKDIIEAAVTGIVIVFLSYVITQFVIGRLTTVATIPTK